MQLQTRLSIHYTDNLPLHDYLYLEWKKTVLVSNETLYANINFGRT